jgi:co-chaperonin GroES (HSP10)
MERCLGVLWETSEEQLEEGIYILSSYGATVNRGTVVRVGVSDVDGLVEEEDIAVRVPRVLVILHASFIGDLTGAQLKEQSRS